ncbi:MAG: LacI family DNA-binding transcriptional regulator [Alkalispirochaeta sp.]
MNIRKIAEIVGMSHMTVSRALNNSPLVAAKTRDRVLEVARSLGYQINAGARGLATGLTMTVGILYPYHRLREVESWYTSQLMHDIRSALWDNGFDTMIAGYETVRDDLSDITRLVAQRKVDALILIGYEITEESLAAVAAITPRYLAVNPPQAPWMAEHRGIFIDQEHGGALAAKTLLAAGRSGISVVLESKPLFDTRYAGFSRAFGGDPVTFLVEDGRFETAYRLAEQNAEELCRSDGIFVGSDVTALGVMSALLDQGVKVPDQVGIVGFDDIEWARYSRPRLTTVHQPRREVAAAAADRIAELVRDDMSGPRTDVFAPRMVMRESC